MEDRYITKGVSESVPKFMQNILWYAIDTMQIKNKDYLQIFELSEVIQDGIKKQKIVHFQEQPEFKDEYIITTQEIINEKVYIIADGKYATMMLDSEY